MLLKNLWKNCYAYKLNNTRERRKASCHPLVIPCVQRWPCRGGRDCVKFGILGPELLHEIQN